MFKEAVTGKRIEGESGNPACRKLWKEGCHSVFLGDEEDPAQEEGKRLEDRESGNILLSHNELSKLSLLV